MKLTAWLVLTASALLLLIANSRAADYLITCNDGGCDSGGQALFADAVVAPGGSVTRSLEIVNNDDKQINVNVNASKQATTDEDFIPYVSLVVQDVNGPIRFSGNVGSFFNQSVDLGAVPAGKVKAIDFTLTLADVPNYYQGKKINFNLPVNLSVPGDSGGGGETSLTTTGTGGTQSVLGSAASPSPKLAYFGFGGQVAGFQTGPEASPEPSPSPTLENGAGILGETSTTNNWYWWLLLLLPLLAWLIKRRFSNH
jgi:hypothetical protein